MPERVVERGVTVPIPQDLEAEASVLGTVLLSETVIGALIQEGLQARMFFRETYGRIWEAMVELHRDGGGIDPITLTDRLKAKGELDAIGGTAAIELLTGSVPAVGNFRTYAQIIVAKARDRQLLMGAYEIQAGLGLDDRAAVDQGLARLREAPIASTSGATLSPDDLTSMFVDWYQADESNAITLPWPKLTAGLFGGLRRGDTSVWAGWPGMGKSIAGDQVLEHGRDVHGLRCCAYVNEMGEVERIARYLAGAAGVPFEAIMKRTLNDAQIRKVLDAAGARGGKGPPYWLEPCAGWSVDRICESILFHRWDLAFIDRVDRVPNYSGKVSEWDQISGKIADAARQSGTHVHMALQLNRERATGAELPMPVKRDLRGTGAWEQDARNIFFVHRRDVFDKEQGIAVTEPDGVIHLAKVSNGRPSVERVFLNYGKQRFYVLAGTEREETEEWAF